MDPAACGFPPGDLRVSDAERDLALSWLGQALQAGRLTAAEFDERAGRAVRARTGKELTALLADLPAGQPAPAPVPASGPSRGVARADGGFASRVTIGAAVAAASFTAIAVANAAYQGPSLAQREYLQHTLARHGVYVPLPPAQGFDWAGTLPWAVVAVLLIGLIVVLRLSRAGRG